MLQARIRNIVVSRPAVGGSSSSAEPERGGRPRSLTSPISMRLAERVNEIVTEAKRALEMAKKIQKRKSNRQARHKVKNASKSHGHHKARDGGGSANAIS